MPNVPAEPLDLDAESCPDLAMLHFRGEVLRRLRTFFHEAGFLEVDTPVRVRAPALEDYIDAQPSGDRWLRTSPELHMKRLLAAGVERLFQIGPCFRRGESGRRHLPEFTMLEWYRAGATWRDVQEDMQKLLHALVQTMHHADSFSVGEHRIDVTQPWQEMTVEQAFRRYARRDLDEALARGEYEEVLVTSVEPHLGLDGPFVLTEYPLGDTGLAKPMPGRTDRAERWELLIAGVEVANACSELVDARDQRARFQACSRKRARQGDDVYPLDEAFLRALQQGIPPSAGVAVGLDRLVMLLADAPDIQHVVPFASER